MTSFPDTTSTTCRGQWLYHEPLAPYTSWRVGGLADRVYKPADLADLVQLISILPENEPITWLGLGSNTLVRDGGIRGTVILTQGCLDELTQLDASTIRAEAGVSCAQLARFSARQGFSCGEFWAGIPGTVGGALVMNAGCSGGETWDSVVAVETLDKKGTLRVRPASDYQYSYREVQGPDEWFCAGHFQLPKGNKEQSLALIRELLDRRAATQPTGDPNGGSVFRNPPGDYAARLIQASGLKGRQVGGAEVSKKHANFIINTGSATATDIEQLIETVAAEVLKSQGVQLIREVRILGEAYSPK
jgi:UDP-N-acetylmuramate dehydrogenase